MVKRKIIQQYLYNQLYFCIIALSSLNKKIMSDNKNISLSECTKYVHAGMDPDPSTGAIMTPIYQTSTYVQEAPGEK